MDPGFHRCQLRQNLRETHVLRLVERMVVVGSLTRCGFPVFSTIASVDPTSSFCEEEARTDTEDCQMATSGPGRLLGLDAFRGFVMLMLISHGFGFNKLLGHPTWGWLALQFNHVPWAGMVFWDLIQPAFILIVGVAIPLAFANRRARGATSLEISRHVVWRSVMLLLISQIIMSIAAGELHFQLSNVLTQIALTYFLAYWILRLSVPQQVLTVGLILVFHLSLFVLFPGSEGAFSRGDNVGSQIDLAVLGNTYPADNVTINFMGETATIMFGAWVGLVLLKKRSRRYHLRFLGAAAVACFVLGAGLSVFVPVIQRLWTTSFVFLSAGCVLLMLLVFYWLIEVRGFRKFAFPFKVLGMNCIFIYVVSIVLYGWLNQSVAVFTGNYAFLGDLAPVAQATTVVLTMWYLCYWLYQRRIFFKV
jgi:predicted acyltransferase